MLDNPKLWRYMDLTKFLTLIINSELYLNRADNYEDIYEGLLTKKDEEILNTNSDLAMICQRNSIFINCWHQNDYESAAMWKLYGVIDDSVAIETDLKTLSELLPPRIEVQKVEYIDYNTDSILKLCSQKTGSLNVHHILAYKRKSFIHEQEYRAIYWHIPVENEPLQPNMSWVHKKGINLKIDISKLIKHIHISPYASPLILSIIQSILEKFELTDIPITKSNLYLIQ
ncbi:DUF2971 domain-containing protein [Acinetobacter sp. ANC 4973]|uniref:DUF2971 domain-containing protein n=1 Tax=Acinetobacter sp. ANC 4973 TaxID=1977871 RepID=UPI000A356322|nr:DUF2971 domain-containing protein [Acinetobacter sp. ANC 4973]OTG99255.1 hypothetical protein B9T30_09970 [Acinetobacter sp. ANC 4973]